MRVLRDPRFAYREVLRILGPRPRLARDASRVRQSLQDQARQGH